MNLLVDSEGPEQTAWIWVFAVHICLKTCFRMVQPIGHSSILPSSDSLLAMNNEKHSFLGNVLLMSTHNLTFLWRNKKNINTLRLKIDLS